MKKILSLFIAVITMGSLLFYVSAYHDKTTHPGLTEQSVDFYNLLSSGNKISDKNKELIIQGSVDEDKGARALNHFYDPVHDIGFENYRTAKDWALKGGETGNKYSWPQVLNNFAQGKEEEAYIALGHILHLVQDMTVPEHTRNDAHKGDGLGGFYTGSSPYESWAMQKDRSALNGLSKKYVSAGEKIMKLSSLEDYFNFLAKYSNSNFFSADTINSDYYLLPELNSLDGMYFYIKDDLSNSREKLLGIYKNKVGERYYAIVDPTDDSILSSYFSRLSKQAVRASAGVIDLFFKEGKAAREQYLADQKIQQQKELEEAKQTAEYLSSKNTFELIPIGLGYLAVDFWNWFTAPVTILKNLAASSYETVASLSGVGAYEGQKVASVAARETEKIANSTYETGIKTITFIQSIPSLIKDTFEDKYSFAFSPSQNIAVSLSAVGAVPPKPYIFLSHRKEKTPPSRPETPLDNIPVEPIITPINIVDFKLYGCDRSLTEQGCLIATTTVYAEWSTDNATDTKYYLVEVNGKVFTTVSSHVALEINSGTPLTLSLSAHGDKVSSATTTALAFVSTAPVVINEVAWAGTAADANDEWIELYNTTPFDINLSGWTLAAADNTPFIRLSKTIPARGYFLLERTDDSTVKDVPADQLFVGALNNTGDQLTLYYASSTIDSTAVLEKGMWPAGSSSGRFSMERLFAAELGTDMQNWEENIGIIKNGIDVGGNRIEGTPGQRNSITYLINRGREITGDIVLTKNESPYVVPIDVVIPASTTLTVDPGVEIKFGEGVELYINGNMYARGDSSEKINFTKFVSEGESSEDFLGANIESWNSGSSLFFDNMVSEALGGIFSQAGIITVTNSSLNSFHEEYPIDCRRCSLLLDNDNFVGGQGIEVYDNAQAQIKNVHISDMRAGVEVYEFSRADIENISVENTGSAVSIYNDSSAFIDKSSLTDSEYGLNVFNSSSASLKNSNVKNNDCDGVVVYDNRMGSSTVSIENSEISFGWGGVDIYRGGSVTIKDSSIHDNLYGIYSSGDPSTITNSQIFNNLDFGVSSNGGILSSIKNWWGDISGPFEEVKNIEGQGNEVKGNVEFVPWLDAVGGEVVEALVASPLEMTMLFEQVTSTTTEDIQTLFNPEENIASSSASINNIEATSSLEEIPLQDVPVESKGIDDGFSSSTPELSPQPSDTVTNSTSTTENILEQVSTSTDIISQTTI